MRIPGQQKSQRVWSFWRCRNRNTGTVTRWSEARAWTTQTKRPMIRGLLRRGHGCYGTNTNFDRLRRREMSTNFTSRTGLRPFVTKREPGQARVYTKADVAEFEALMRIMQEAHFDALGKFYGGAKLTYDKSVTQKILVAAVREVGDKLGAGVKNPQSPGANWVLERAKGLARLVMKHESAYIIDNVGAALYDKAASAMQDQLQEVVLKGVPVVGLLKTGWDALATTGDALDKLVRTGIAHRHAIELKAGEPRAAADAVQKLLARKAGMLAVSGASSTAAFAVGVAAEAGSLGAAVGTAELATSAMQAVVDVVLKLTQIIIDIIDFERGNMLLNNLPEIVNPSQDTVVKMFKGCPVLGCYMLATPIFPTSAFVYLMSKPGAIASVDEVERVAIGHVNPLRLEASWLIRQSAFTMSNPESKEANDQIRLVMKGKSEDEIQQALEFRNLHREAAGDAATRSEYLDRSLVERGLEYATRAGPSQYANNAAHGIGSDGKTHLYTRHEGKLRGLSEKLRKFKKTAITTFTTNTRLGRFANEFGKDAGLVDETEAELELKKQAMRAPPAGGPKPVAPAPMVAPGKPLPKPPGAAHAKPLPKPPGRP